MFLFLLFVVGFCLFSSLYANVFEENNKSLSMGAGGECRIRPRPRGPLVGGCILHTHTGKPRERQAPYSVNLTIINTIKLMQHIVPFMLLKLEDSLGNNLHPQ